MKKFARHGANVGLKRTSKINIKLSSKNRFEIILFKKEYLATAKPQLSFS